jgi:hypothetical protein
LKNIILSIVLIFTLSNCSPSPESIQKAMTQTLAAAIPTQLPLSELNLESLLIQDGDLPLGYSGGDVYSVPSGAFNWLSDKGIKNFKQDIIYGGNPVGNVTVFLYDDISLVGSTFTQMVDSMGYYKSQNLIEVGEKSNYMTASRDVLGVKVEVMQLVFLRCQAVINILITNSSDTDNLANYGSELDKRLTKLVCR